MNAEKTDYNSEYLVGVVEDEIRRGNAHDRAGNLYGANECYRGAAVAATAALNARDREHLALLETARDTMLSLRATVREQQAFIDALTKGHA